MYHKGFFFSIDSYGLDQKQPLGEVFLSRDESKKKSLLVLPSPFNDTMNHRPRMKSIVNQHLSSLKRGRKKCFDPLFFYREIRESVP